MSRRTNLWLAARKKWVKLNPPNHQGYYVCAYCSRWIQDLTLDHIIPRSRRPDLVTDLGNLVPACGPCNMRKGSRVVA